MSYLNDRFYFYQDDKNMDTVQYKYYKATYQKLKTVRTAPYILYIKVLSKKQNATVFFFK